MTTALQPKLLGFWTKCIRETSHWSQEALAASSNLDVRTIQRIEAGKPVSLTTRRALARGLGYEKQDIFEDPNFIKAVHDLLQEVDTIRKKDFEKQFPDHIPLKATAVISGEALGQIAEFSDAYFFHCDDEISQKAKELAASIFDWLTDLGDIISDISNSQKVQYNRELDAMLTRLFSMGAKAYCASRSTKMVGTFWKDKTPIPLVIGYLTIAPESKTINELMVPRRLL